MNTWKVPNASYNLSLEDLSDVPKPFIAHLGKAGFVLVSEINENSICVSNEKWNKHSLTIGEFKNSFTGNILAAEKDETSGEVDYAVKHRMEVIENMRVPIVTAGAVILFLMSLLLNRSYINSISWSIIALTTFKTIGLITTILLLTQSIDAHNPLIQKLCGSDNKKNCNAILSSKAAKITENLSWSEIGFFYFAGTWLAFLSSYTQANMIQVLALLNLLSIPYTAYSIYYQWRVAKQWCTFCCIVQAVLWLEFFAFLPYLTIPIQMPALTDWANLFISLTAPVLIWIFIKPYLLLSKQVKPLKHQLRQFKYNPELFNNRLNDEVKFILPSQEESLIIGSSEAEHVITMVSNPYCQPCARAHKALDSWLSTRNDVKLQVIFTSVNEQDKKAEVASHLMSLKTAQDSVSLKRALDDWYEQKQKNYSSWAKQYPVAKLIDNTSALQVQREWCNMAEITGTPTFFINGRRLPKPYQPEDIKYFI